jgi:hypothetical protein
MHSKNVTFRPEVSVRHMHRAKQCMPNSRMMSEGCATRLRVVMMPTMTLHRMPNGRAFTDLMSGPMGLGIQSMTCDANELCIFRATADGPLLSRS